MPEVAIHRPGNYPYRYPPWRIKDTLSMPVCQLGSPKTVSTKAINLGWQSRLARIGGVPKKVFYQSMPVPAAEPKFRREKLVAPIEWLVSRMALVERPQWGQIPQQPLLAESTY